MLNKNNLSLLLFVSVLQALTSKTTNPACVVASGKGHRSSICWNLIAWTYNSQAKLQVNALVMLFQERLLKVFSHSLGTNAPNNKRFQGHSGAKSFQHQRASYSMRRSLSVKSKSLPLIWREKTAKEMSASRQMRSGGNKGNIVFPDRVM